MLDKLDDLAQARGKSTAQVTLAWILTKPAVTSAIVGISTPDQLDKSLRAVGLRLTGEAMAQLDLLTKWGE